MLENVILIVFLAIIIEYIVNIVKPIFPDTSYPIPLIISLILGVGLGLLVRVDLLTAIGFQPVNQMVSYVITGLMASGGSTAVHELISKLRASRSDIQAE